MLIPGPADCNDASGKSLNDDEQQSGPGRPCTRTAASSGNVLYSELDLISLGTFQLGPKVALQP